MSRFAVLTALLLSLAMTDAHAQKASCEEREIGTLDEVRERISGREIIESVRNAYRSAQSYSDTGDVLVENQPIGATMIVEHHQFQTRYAAPRQFFFEFTKSTMAGKENIVVWSPGDGFNTWWSVTKVSERYPPGRGATAFAVSALPSEDTVLVIPSLLFSTADLIGPITTIDSAEIVAIEDIGGHCTYVLSSNARLNHWSDAVRPTKLWVDTESLLIRKMIEDTPSNASADSVQRRTIIFSPALNPQITDSTFQFTPSGS